MMHSQGIVYIAIGQQALDMAIDSAKSIVNTSSVDQPITVLCDSDYCDIDSKISFINIGNYSGSDWKDKSCIAAYLKTKLCELSPYDKTLYLDNDIRAVKDISVIWDYLDYGIGFCKAFNPLVKGVEYPNESEEAYTADLISNWYQYNSGMFLFVKSPEVCQFFQDWNLCWQTFRTHENMALTRLVDRDVSEVFELPCKFNDFYPNKNHVSVLIHYIGWYKVYL